jgi:hypothetical protein
VNKYTTYTDAMLAFALADCYETLRVGAYPLGRYPDEHPYARKLWADIDAIRDVQMSRRAVRSAVGRKVAQPA